MDVRSVCNSQTPPQPLQPVAETNKHRLNRISIFEHTIRFGSVPVLSKFKRYVKFPTSHVCRLTRKCSSRSIMNTYIAKSSVSLHATLSVCEESRAADPCPSEVLVGSVAGSPRVRPVKLLAGVEKYPPSNSR